MVIPFTKRAIDAQKPKDKAYPVYFEVPGTPGLRMEVFPSGHKTVYLDYRPREAGEAAGRSVPKKAWRVGVYGPEAVDQLLRKAANAVENIRQGRDPAAERAAERNAITIAQLVEKFKAEHVQTKCKATTQEAHGAALARLCAAHGALKAKAIGDRLDKMHLAKAEEPSSANRALRVYGKLYSWARGKKLVPKDCDPTAGIEPYPEQGRERFLTTDELMRLGAALAEGESIGLPYSIDETKPKAKHAAKAESRRVRLDPFAVAAIRLLLLTGARLREVLDAQWSQVDFERGILFLPDSKTGKKPIYLSAAAQTVLANLPRVEGNPHVIAGAKGGAPRADLKKPWASVCRAAGLEGVRLHDLRHSFASFGAGASLGLPIIGKLLGHTQAATTQRYAHLDADPLHRAANAIGATIAAAMEGKKGAEVVPFHKQGGSR